MGANAGGTARPTGEATGDRDTASGARRSIGVDDPQALATATLATLQCRRIASCPHCRSAALQRWGRGRSGAQRWRCRDCRRSFSSTTGTPLHGLHAPARLRLVLVDMLSAEPSSCRRLAGELGVCAMTIWGWRQRVARALALLATAPADDAGGGRGVAATAIVRESLKASREWVDHARDPQHHPAPDRLRWVDYRIRHLPLPQPMTRYLLPVRLGTAAPGIAAGRLSPQQRQAPAIGGRQPPGAATRARAAGGHDPRFDRDAGPALNAAALVERFRSFLRPFRGPVTRHLDGYVAWFAARRGAAGSRGPAAVAARTWALLATPRPTRSWTWPGASA